MGLRLFNVYGPKQDPGNPYSGVITIFFKNIINNENVVINGGHQTRDFINVYDVCKIMDKSMCLIEKNNICDVINVGTGVPCSINDLFEKIRSLCNKNPKIKRNQLEKSDPEISSGNFTKMNHILNLNKFNFLSLDEGLLRMNQLFY